VKVATYTALRYWRFGGWSAPIYGAPDAVARVAAELREEGYAVQLGRRDQTEWDESSPEGVLP
jgi:hypothetical protein